MENYELGASIRLATIAIRVRDRDKMIAFYRDIVGFDLKREENELAIFGLSNKESELLWLEESPRANEHFNEIKKLHRLSLVVPTSVEMGEVMARFTKYNYPIEESIASGGQLTIFTNDPEGNRLEFYHGVNPSDTADRLTKKQLLALATGKYAKLSEDVRFDKVQLNVSDRQAEQTFLQNILGFKISETDEALHVLNTDQFHVGLVEASGGTIDLPTDEVLGLDFMKFAITQDELLALEAHFTKKEQDFYINKKKTVMTIYDSIGIEWWFSVEKS